MAGGDNRTQITVAIIGAIALIVAAVINKDYFSNNSKPDLDEGVEICSTIHECSSIAGTPHRIDGRTDGAARENAILLCSLKSGLYKSHKVGLDSENCGDKLSVMNSDGTSFVETKPSLCNRKVKFLSTVTCSI